MVPLMAIVVASPRRAWRQQLARLDWRLIVLLTLIAGAGVATLYSVAGGSWTPWAARHATRFALALVLMAAMGLVAMRYWMALAWPVYFVSLFALLLVPFFGEVNMGARRWLDFGGLQFQPSEAMKIGLVLGLARYYHGLRPDRVSQLPYLAPPLAMIAAPVLLVFMQPDLGTALMLGATGAAVVLLAGLSWRLAALGVVAAAAAGYAAYAFKILKPYQLERIFTFLDPGRDPLGQGYHLMQSKIALGSGGVSGKGFMQGTQSQLNFLPEMHTDFIFTIFGEEFGFVGAIGLLALYFMTILEGISVANRARSHFARLVVMGVVVTLALYVLINTGMVMGLAPVVGVPLPLVSYGGTVMLTIMAGFGLVMSAHTSRDAESHAALGGR